MPNKLKSNSLFNVSQLTKIENPQVFRYKQNKCYNTFFHTKIFYPCLKEKLTIIHFKQHIKKKYFLL